MLRQIAPFEISPFLRWQSILRGGRTPAAWSPDTLLSGFNQTQANKRKRNLLRNDDNNNNNGDNDPHQQEEAKSIKKQALSGSGMIDFASRRSHYQICDYLISSNTFDYECLHQKLLYRKEKGNLSQKRTGKFPVDDWNNFDLQT